MNKEFIPYKQALALKELGFDEDVLEYYNTETKEFCDVMKEIKAPLYQQAFRWFRDKYFIHCEIGRDFDNWDYELYDFKSGNKHIPTGYKTFKTYEETELECVKKLIEIVKLNNQIN